MCYEMYRETKRGFVLDNSIDWTNGWVLTTKKTT